VVRVLLTGSATRTEVRFVADQSVDSAAAELAYDEAVDPLGLLVQPTRVAATLLRHAGVQVAQEVGARRAVVQWVLPSLKEVRRRQREAAG
jgi:hypothetical protein